MMTAPKSTALRDTAGAADSRDHSFAAGAVRPGVRSATTEAARIDEEFLGRSRGNLADYAMRTGQLHQAAAAKLRSIASISARDPRCISAMGPDGAQTGLKLATSLQIMAGFRAAMAAIRSAPAPMRTRFETAKKLANGSSASMKQVAIIADAMAQDLYAHGDPQGAFQFASLSGLAVNRVVSANARIAAQLDKVVLR